jgi:hypothetical protein
MKAIAALALLGLISSAEARVPNALAQVDNRNLVQVMSTSSSSSSSDDDSLVQLDAEISKPCEYLDETQAELDYQVDMFSRTLDPRHWTNVLNITKAMREKQGSNPKLEVHTWELYNRGFSFPRVRRYNYVNENMDMLEHFQDNLNTNISNSVHMANFLRVANTVRKNFNDKYHDGEFDDPGAHDPRAEAELIEEKGRQWHQL